MFYSKTFRGDSFSTSYKHFFKTEKGNKIGKYFTERHKKNNQLDFSFLKGTKTFLKNE